MLRVFCPDRFSDVIRDLTKDPNTDNHGGFTSLIDKLHYLSHYADDPSNGVTTDARLFGDFAKNSFTFEVLRCWEFHEDDEVLSNSEFHEDDEITTRVQTVMSGGLIYDERTNSYTTNT